ncbi:unnamed protein product [Ectocarpus sp. 13 AM-2016]
MLAPPPSTTHNSFGRKWNPKNVPYQSLHHVTVKPSKRNAKGNPAGGARVNRQSSRPESLFSLTFFISFTGDDADRPNRQPTCGGIRQRGSCVDISVPKTRLQLGRARRVWQKVLRNVWVIGVAGILQLFVESPSYSCPT